MLARCVVYVCQELATHIRNICLDIRLMILQLREEAFTDEVREARRVKALWDEACEHAVRKQGHMAVAWQRVQGVSEKHLYEFHERYGTRVRERHPK